jgi:methyltransferase FkbM-like protein
MDFIKIDVQGYELSVLRGAARVLETNADIVVLLESWPHGLRAAGDTPMALVDYLSKECGLQLYGVKGRRLTFFDAKSMGGELGSYCNVLAVRAVSPSLSDMLR